MKSILKQKIIELAKTPLPPPSLCKKCKVCGSDLKVMVRQTRSADEGMTTFEQCNKCNRTWKT